MNYTLLPPEYQFTQPLRGCLSLTFRADLMLCRRNIETAQTLLQVQLNLRSPYSNFHHFSAAEKSRVSCYYATKDYCFALAIASSRANVSLVKPSMLDLSTSVPHTSRLRAAINAFASNLAGVTTTAASFVDRALCVPCTSESSRLSMPGRESLGGSFAKSSSNPGAAPRVQWGGL